jgi:uncharacterized protein (DUF427 family)
VTTIPGHTISTEPAPGRVRVEFGGQTVADSTRAVVLHETGLPPRLYVPPDDVRADLLTATDHHTRCPFKGEASYWTISVGDRVAENAAWAYEDPLPGREDIKGHMAFYPDRVDAIVEG